MSEIADRFRRRADAFEALIVGTPPELWNALSRQPGPDDAPLQDGVLELIGRDPSRQPTS